MTSCESIKSTFKKAASLVVAAPLTLSSSVALAAGSGGAAGSSGMALGAVTFAQPWMLLGLGALPLMWWLMKSVPPTPKKEDFPAVQILFNLKSEDQEPAKMPLWQRILRLSAAALVVAGLSQPLLTPENALEGEGPIVLVVDDGWASGPNWSERVKKMKSMVDRAENDGREIMILSTAAPEDGRPIQATKFLDADEARSIIDVMEPHPWAVDRTAARYALEHLQAEEDASVVWLSNGLNDDGASVLEERLKELGKLTVFEDGDKKPVHLLKDANISGSDLIAVVLRSADSDDETITLTARDASGNALGQAKASFDSGELKAEAKFDLPLELRNQVDRVSIDGEDGAGATMLLDERWRRRPVGLVRNEEYHASQSLLDGGSYVEKALDPYVDLHTGDIDELFQSKMAVMVVTDEVVLDTSERKEIDEWVRNGGTLLRFAGPHLADQPDDDLVPVELRQGVRHIGDGVSSNEDGRLREFPKDSPFYGIELPDNVTIERQILAQPGPDLQERTWALLEDVSPLVTAEQRGSGWVVLVHTSADARWSNLPLSGLFVDMMRAVVAHSQGVSGEPEITDSALPAINVLDGEGQLTSPSSSVHDLSKEAIEEGYVGPGNPPGLYGKENVRYAHNLSDGVSELEALPFGLKGDSHETYAETLKQNDLGGPMLVGALSLMLIDLLVLLGQQGHFSRGKRKEKNQAPEPTSASPSIT